MSDLRPLLVTAAALALTLTAVRAYLRRRVHELDKSFQAAPWNRQPTRQK